MTATPKLTIAKGPRISVAVIGAGMMNGKDDVDNVPATDAKMFERVFENLRKGFANEPTKTANGR